MAASTGIGWTDGTVNFIIGCAPAGPGCDACYASAFAFQKWKIEFKPGGERRETKSGFTEPLRWQRMHERGQVMMKNDREKVPVWVFACSLSDFFDKEWPAGVRDRAWAVIRECRSIRWQIVTKRVGIAHRMLPSDWDDGRNYPHVGIVTTMVNQEEIDRDMPKLRALKTVHGVRWIGLSIEPQLGMIVLGDWLKDLDWVITGGESKQGDHKPRMYDLNWPAALVRECFAADVPIFVKQMGDNPHYMGGYTKQFGGNGGGDQSKWPEHLRVQKMPTIYDHDPHEPEPAESLEELEEREARCTVTPDLFNND